jgi:rod shape-determining protein MreD
MNRGLFYYSMIPLLLLVALLQSTALAKVAVRGVKPDVVLLLVLVGTLLYGGKPGIGWAFVGGLALDSFSGGPLGSSSLALMMAATVAGLGHRTLSRFNPLVPLGMSALGTLIYGVLYVLLINGQTEAAIWLKGQNLPVEAPYELRLPLWASLQFIIAPAMLYNTALMLFLVPLLNRVPESQDVAVG